MNRLVKRAIQSLLLPCWLASASLAGPAGKISDDTFNFGKVVQNATTTHTFWLKSVGDQTLKITEVVPGCGCTQIPLTDSSIAPGDSAKLLISFSTRSFIGNVNKRPYVMTNASTAKIGMSLFADIMTEPEAALPAVLHPARLDVSQFTVQPRRRATFEIVNRSGDDLKLRAIDTAGKSFTVELPSVVMSGATVKGTVTVRKSAIETAFKESFTFEAIGAETRDNYTLPVERLYRVKDTAATTLTPGAR